MENKVLISCLHFQSRGVEVRTTQTAECDLPSFFMANIGGNVFFNEKLVSLSHNFGEQIETRNFYSSSFIFFFSITSLLHESTSNQLGDDDNSLRMMWAHKLSCRCLSSHVWICGRNNLLAKNSIHISELSAIFILHLNTRLFERSSIPHIVNISFFCARWNGATLTLRNLWPNEASKRLLENLNVIKHFSNCVEVGRKWINFEFLDESFPIDTFFMRNSEYERTRTHGWWIKGFYPWIFYLSDC